jgi:3-oxoacyl-[acyl-carrier-protein] synthase II
MSSSVPIPVSIASVGCVSPLGFGMPETSSSLLAGTSGITPVRLFSVDGCQCRTAGQVDERLADAASAIAPRSRRWSRAAQMVLVAMEDALKGCPGFRPDVVVIGTTSGGMSLGEEFFRALASGKNVAHATRKVRNYVPHQPIIQSLEVFGSDAPVRIISNACASGSNALGIARQLIRDGMASSVLAGGYDAIAELVFAGFDCLKASTPEICRPFDARRSGLALGEGAAMFCLRSGAGELQITGYGSAIDTHHLTQPHPSGRGPELAMVAALQDAQLPPGSIDYINAHGTGTPLNDSSEGRAIQNVCPSAPTSSTKSMTGHSLGAAGAIEAAFSVAALRSQFLPPNINFHEGDPDIALNIVANTSRAARLRNVLSNSFGFGGSNASIILSLT